MSEVRAAEGLGTVDELIRDADRPQGEDGRVGDAGRQGPGEAFGAQNPERPGVVRACRGGDGFCMAATIS